MKTIFLALLIFSSLLVYAPIQLSAQKKTKIYTWEIVNDYVTWYYCSFNGNIDSKCIEKVSLTFTNNSRYRISKLVIRLKIYNEKDVLLYNRKHTIQLDLDPGETGNCKEFKLYERLNNNNGFEDASWGVEILSIL